MILIKVEIRVDLYEGSIEKTKYVDKDKFRLIHGSLSIKFNWDSIERITNFFIFFFLNRFIKFSDRYLQFEEVSYNDSVVGCSY